MAIVSVTRQVYDWILIVGLLQQSKQKSISNNTLFAKDRFHFNKITYMILENINGTATKIAHTLDYIDIVISFLAGQWLSILGSLCNAAEVFYL